MKAKTPLLLTATANKANNICRRCKTVVASDDLHLRKNRPYHEACFQLSFWKCGDCSLYFSQKKTDYYNYCGSKICVPCYEEYYFTCPSCDEVTPSDDGYSSDYSDTYCNDCFNDRYTYCYGCDNSFPRDDVTYCDECENDFCYDCSCDCEIDTVNTDNESIAYNGDTSRVNLSKPPFLEGKKTPDFPFDDYIGLEIECFGSQDLNLKDCVIGGDSSIMFTRTNALSNARGREVKTLPANRDRFLTILNETLSELKSKKYQVNKSCGLHVHINVKPLMKQPQKLARVIRTYYAFEDVIYSMIRQDRWTNQYCYPLRKNYTFEELKCKNYQGFQNKWKKTNKGGGYTRYQSFNAESIFQRGSLEVRAYNSTLSANEIKNWIYVLLTIKKWSEKKYNKQTIEFWSKQKLTPKKVGMFLKLFGFNKNKAIKKYIITRIRQNNPLALSRTKDNYWAIRQKYFDCKRKHEKIKSSFNKKYNDYRNKMYRDDYGQYRLSVDNPFEKFLEANPSYKKVSSRIDNLSSMVTRYDEEAKSMISEYNN